MERAVLRGDVHSSPRAASYCRLGTMDSWARGNGCIDALHINKDGFPTLAVDCVFRFVMTRAFHPRKLVLLLYRVPATDTLRHIALQESYVLIAKIAQVHDFDTEQRGAACAWAERAASQMLPID